jgi:hypothetical protein
MAVGINKVALSATVRAWSFDDGGSHSLALTNALNALVFRERDYSIAKFQNATQHADNSVKRHAERIDVKDTSLFFIYRFDAFWQVANWNY